MHNEIQGLYYYLKKLEILFVKNLEFHNKHYLTVYLL